MGQTEPFTVWKGFRDFIHAVREIHCQLPRDQISEAHDLWHAATHGKNYSLLTSPPNP